MFLPSRVLALIGVGTPFGGMVLFEIPCTCSGSSMIFVGPPRPGTFIIDSGTRIYEKYQPFVGHWVLGLADASVPCLEATPVGCIPVGEGGRIRIVGTS